MAAMHDERSEVARGLGKGRAALERGRLRSAVRHVWDAAHAAVRRNDEQGLQAVIELAEAIRDRSSGRVQKDAQMAATYCSHCLAEARSGVRRRSPLAWLLGRERREPVKTCPDCAETIKAAARVCRFCGYRFDGPEETPAP